MDPHDVDAAAGTAHEALILDGAAGEARLGGAGAEAVCDNCGTVVTGPYCGQCGQRDDDLRRPFWALFAETLESAFALDGRLARTLPTLMLRPGVMTRAYLDGARARYVSPFRLFLFSSLIFFLVFSLPGGEVNFNVDGDMARRASAETLAEFDAQLADLPPDTPPAVRSSLESARDLTARSIAAQAAEATTGEGGAPAPAQTGPGAPDLAADPAADPRATVEGEWSREHAKCIVIRLLTPEDTTPACLALTAESDVEVSSSLPGGARRYLAHNISEAIDNPDAYLAAVNRWAPRMVIVLFPVFALLLALLHVWRRDALFFDHLVTSLHFHAFSFVLLVVLRLVSPLVSGAVAALAFLAITGWCLYRVMRRVYRDSRIGAGLRVLALSGAYTLVLAFAGVGLATLGVLFI